MRRILEAARANPTGRPTSVVVSITKINISASCMGLLSHRIPDAGYWMLDQKAWYCESLLSISIQNPVSSIEKLDSFVRSYAYKDV
jgi:hypothetical protein